MYQKLKLFIANDLVFTSLLLFGVAIASFVLGRASVTEQGVFVPDTATLPAVVLQTAPTLPPATATRTETVGIIATSTTRSGDYVASKSGTKYHLVTCPGAKQIKEENKIFFVSTAEAEAAGYTKASNCPNL